MSTAPSRYSAGGPFGYRAPASLHVNGDDWVDLDMAWIHQIKHMSDTSDILGALRKITDRAITDITITTAEETEKAQAQQAARPRPKPQPAKPGMERPNKSDALQPVSARDESRARVRSQMFAQWGLKCERVFEEVGFAPCTAQPNTQSAYAIIADTDPLAPCVLDLLAVCRICMRGDAHGRTEWRFFKRTNQHPQTEEEIPDVYVLGDETGWPTRNGQLRSSLARLMLSDAYTTYQSKMTLTQLADRQRAHPVLVTQAAAAAGAGGAMSDPDLVTGSITMRDNDLQLVPVALSAAQRAQVNKVADSCARANQQVRNEPGPICNPDVTQGGAGQKRKSRDGQTEYEISPGQVLAPGVHLAEAPLDLLPAKQAWMEAVSLDFGVPLSMLSSGDATGKAKLNAESAGPETARLYLEGQNERRRELENNIAAMYTFMYSKRRVLDTIAKTLESSKGLRTPSDTDLDKVRTSTASVIVRVAGTMEPDAAMSLFKDGVLRYQSTVEQVCRFYHLSQDQFEPTCLIPVRHTRTIVRCARACCCFSALTFVVYVGRGPCRRRRARPPRASRVEPTEEEESQGKEMIKPSTRN